MRVGGLNNPIVDSITLAATYHDVIQVCEDVPKAVLSEKVMRS